MLPDVRFLCLNKDQIFLRDKRLFEITEVEITRVDCSLLSFSLRFRGAFFFYKSIPLTKQGGKIIGVASPVSIPKNSKNWDTINYHRDCPTNGIVRFYSAILRSKDADRIPNRVDTDQTAPRGAV